VVVDWDLRTRKMAAPPGQIVAMRLDHILGKAVSGDLAQLFLTLSKACAIVAEDENFEQSTLVLYLTSPLNSVLTASLQPISQFKRMSRVSCSIRGSNRLG